MFERDFDQIHNLEHRQKDQGQLLFSKVGVLRLDELCISYLCYLLPEELR